MAELQQSDYLDADLSEVGEYRAISLLAVAGGLLGLASIAAFAHPLLWVLPIAGVIVSALALVRIAQREPSLTGRGIAWLGLCLSLVFGTAAPTRVAIVMGHQRAEARRLAGEWFSAMADGRPDLAISYMVAPESRQAPDEDHWATIRSDPDGPRAMRAFVSQPAVRAMLELGHKATVRLVAVDDDIETTSLHRLVMVYAVTFEDEGAKKSFLVRLTLDRRMRGPQDPGAWTVSRAEFVEEPPSFLQS